MKASIQRIREIKKTTDGYLVYCTSFEIKTKKMFYNGQYVILLEGVDIKILDIKKMFDFVNISESRNLEFDIGEDVTEYIPAGLFE